jgi:protein SCO1/2
MKTKFAVVVLALLTVPTGRSLLAGDSAEPSRAGTLPITAVPNAGCCAAAPVTAAKGPTPCCAVVGKKSCCDPLPAGAPLSARSLYQLDATWTNDVGQTVKLASLRSQPVVVAMFFACCEYACPVLVSDLQRLRAASPAAVHEQTRFVLVRFATVRDTTAALAAYRAKLPLDGGWMLLRGDAMDVQDFAMLLGVKYTQDARGQFAHSNLITVLNPAGEIAHQHAGLQGGISEAAKAVVAVAIRASFAAKASADLPPAIARTIFMSREVNPLEPWSDKVREAPELVAAAKEAAAKK